MKYVINLEIFTQDGKKVFEKSRLQGINYTPETFLACENLLRDTVKDLADEAINAMWYK